jgi:uncharacterized protein (TIGR02588 family)
MTGTNKNNQEKLNDAPPWMWGLGLLGLLFVLGSIGYMLYEALAGDSSPPDVSVKIQSVLPTQNGFRVEFRVVNAGGRAAKGLNVAGELRAGDDVVETSETTIDYVPSHSERQGGLFFTLDPQLYDLQLRAEGYETP